MTAKEKKAASARMKAIWAKRKAVSSVTATASVSNGGFTVAHQPLIDVIPAGEVNDIVVIVDFMRKLSPNGRKFIIKKFTPNA